VRRLLLFLLLLALAGCAAPQKPESGDITIVWNRVDNPHPYCEGLSGRKEFFRILGCSKWNDQRADGTRVCSIYAPAPRDERDLQRFATLGHELMHCVEGNWHDRWGHMNPKDRTAVGASAAPKPVTAAD